jgi:hypothetical protein
MKGLTKLIPTALVLTIGCVNQASAITCFFTLMKDSCWTDYDVTVKVVDASNKKPLTNITVPKGKSWNRVTFTCDEGQSFNYSATFTPTFWKADEGKVFPGNRTWMLPEKLQKGDTAWNITLCYPEQFSEVPMPPTAAGSCVCDAKKIPPVTPPKKAS